MAERFRDVLLKSPVLAVVLGMGALGLAFVPFAVTSTDHAAQFYGSLVAALVAAGAVIAGGFVQARLTQIRDDRLQLQEHKIQVVQLFGFFQYVEDRLARLERGYAHITYKQKDPAKKDREDETILSASLIRRASSINWNQDWKQLLPAAAALNRELAARVIASLYGIAYEFETFYSMSGVLDEHKVYRYLVENVALLAKNRVTETRGVKQALGLYLAQLEAKAPHHLTRQT